MSMSKHQFEALARSLRELKADLDKASADNCDNSINFAFERHVRRVAGVCSAVNENFQFGRFYIAAGIKTS